MKLKLLGTLTDPLPAHLSVYPFFPLCSLVHSQSVPCLFPLSHQHEKLGPSPPHPRPSCPHRVLHQQLLHRGGCHELLQAAGAAPGRQRDQAQRHARWRTPLPAPGQPHRDLSATGRRVVPPRLFAFGLMVWFGFWWKVWDRPCDRGPWALSLVFFPVGSFRWSQGTGSLLLRDMTRPFPRQKWLAEGVNPEVPVPEISLPSRSSQWSSVLNHCLSNRTTVLLK